jgi:hypothetical protein
MIEKHDSWTTKNEIAFIKGIGSHAIQSSSVKSKTKVELLKGYLHGSLNRDWGSMNKDEIIKFANAEIHRHKQSLK